MKLLSTAWFIGACAAGSASYAQNHDTDCDSVLTYTGRNFSSVISKDVAASMSYLSKCDTSNQNGNLDFLYKVISIGVGYNSSNEACSDEKTKKYTELLNQFSSSSVATESLAAWNECKRLNSAGFQPDLSATNGVVTVGIKNTSSTQPRKVALNFVPDDHYGEFSYTCSLSLAGVPQQGSSPFVVDVPALVRAIIRCNIPMHSYVSSEGVMLKARPGGTMTVDTETDSYSIKIFAQEDEFRSQLAALEDKLTQATKVAIGASSVNLANCEIPNDGNWVNGFDAPVDFICPPNKVIVGEHSYHNNETEDRRFRFRCCSLSLKAAQ